MPRKLRAAQKQAAQHVETVGERVAQARRRLGVTLKQDILSAHLARMAKVQPSTISRLEAGLHAPSEELILKLAEVLRVTPAWLRYGAAAEASPVIAVSEPQRGSAPDGE